MDKLRKKMPCMCTLEYCSLMKESLPFVITWVDPQSVMLSEISETKRGIYDLTYMWNIKKHQLK